MSADSLNHRRPPAASRRSSTASSAALPPRTCAASVRDRRSRRRWFTTPTCGIFLALGAAATIGGVLRGHLVFTALMNPARLARERRRTHRPTQLLDLLTALLLFANAAIVAGARALPAVLAIVLAVGIALASLGLEPATTAAAFGGEA